MKSVNYEAPTWSVQPGCFRALSTHWDICIVTYMSDYRRGFGMDTGFIGHLHTRLGITSYYSTTANLHNSQITTTPAKPFPPAVSSPAVPWQRLLTLEIFQLLCSSPLWMAAPFQLTLFFKDSRTELAWWSRILCYDRQWVGQCDLE
jgi:hypothetical protein